MSLASLRQPGVVTRRANRATSLAGAARGADDHEELAWSGPAWEWLRRNAELLREPDGDAVALGWEEHRRLRIGEVVCAADLLDAVAERADAARHLSGVVDVAAAVQDVDRDAPRRRENGARAALRRLAARPGDQEQGREDGKSDHDSAYDQQAGQRAPDER